MICTSPPPALFFNTNPLIGALVSCIVTEPLTTWLPSKVLEPVVAILSMLVVCNTSTCDEPDIVPAGVSVCGVLVS